MPRTIRLKILMLIVGLMVATSITFLFITIKNFQEETTTQSHRLARETLTSSLRTIDNAYSDLLSYEIDTLDQHKDLMKDVGDTILSMVELYYDLQKNGFLTEQLAKELFLKRLKGCRYHKNNYFFVYDFDLNGLSHPSRKMVGEKWSGFEDLKKRDALSQIRKTIRTEQKLFTVFMWPRLKDMRQVKQLGFFFYYPKWEWILGTTQEISLIQKISLSKENATRSKLQTVLAQANLNEIGGILIFDSHGKTISHTSNIKGIDLYLTGSTLSEPVQGHLKKAAGKDRKPVEYRHNERIQIAYVDYYKYMDWYIAAYIDKNQTKKPIFDIAVKQSVILLLILLVGIIVAFFISGKIAFSISSLAQYAKNLSSYDFNLGANPELGSIRSDSSCEEVKELADAFVLMESRLGQNIRDMAKYQENLEEIVNKRTEELTGVNKTLNREIHERRKSEKVVMTLNKSLDKKVQERTYELKRLNEHIIYTEEKERKEVAADLHDSVAQTLALSISKIKTIQESGVPIDLGIIAEIKGHLEQTVKETRSLIYQLSPPILDDFEIDIALEFLITESNEKYGVDIKYIKCIDHPIHIDKSKKIILYRAINELIINIIKHSGSKEAEIELSENKDFIFLRVEDAGVGFDLNKLKDINFRGFGLYSISERITNLGGHFTLSSKPGKGTKILISLPYP